LQTIRSKIEEYTKLNTVLTGYSYDINQLISKLEVDEEIDTLQLSALNKLALGLISSQLIPVLDMLKLTLLRKEGHFFFSFGTPALHRVFHLVESTNDPKIALICLRVISNMFNSKNGREFCVKYSSQIIMAICNVMGTIAQDVVHTAAATVIFNFCVEVFFTKNDTSGLILLLLSTFEVLPKNLPDDALIRVYMGLGLLASCGRVHFQQLKIVFLSLLAANTCTSQNVGQVVSELKHIFHETVKFHS